MARESYTIREPYEGIAHPRGSVERLSVIGLRLGGLSKGLRPIDDRPVLDGAGFGKIEIVPCHQWCGPLELAQAKRACQPVDGTPVA